MQDEQSTNKNLSLQSFTKFLRSDRFLKDVTNITDIIKEQGNCLDTILFDYTLSISAFQQIMKWNSLINLFTLYKSFVGMLVILFYQ